MKVVFASSNAGKIIELQNLCQPFNIEIIPQSDLGVRDVPETGLTFVENALIKARHACQVTGLPALADDSGLEVKILQGKPGIHSARYAGENASSTNNIQKLLKNLENYSEADRAAIFHCVLVFLLHANDPTPLICQGTWQGRILLAPQGKQGFGYDPVFFDPDQGCSAAELDLTLKNQISHRGKALRQLINHLREKL